MIIIKIIVILTVILLLSIIIFYVASLHWLHVSHLKCSRYISRATVSCFFIIIIIQNALWCHSFSLVQSPYISICPTGWLAPRQVAVQVYRLPNKRMTSYLGWDLVNQIGSLSHARGHLCLTGRPHSICIRPAGVTPMLLWLRPRPSPSHTLRFQRSNCFVCSVLYETTQMKSSCLVIHVICNLRNVYLQTEFSLDRIVSRFSPWQRR